jgi:hypothetical protein
MSAVEEYLDNHPFRPWDQHSWDERSALIDLAFHKTDVLFSPLIGNSMTMPDGVGWDQYWYTGAELVQSHVNHNTIGRYDRWTAPIYVDTRQRRVRARHRWGVKTQYDQMDEMVTRYGNDTDRFINAVLASQMADQIVGVQEKVARDGMLDFALHKFIAGTGNAFSTTGTDNFSGISTNSASAFNVKLLEDIALRMSYRSEEATKAWGNYAQPVPGSNFRGSVLVMVTTGVYDSIWQSEDRDWLIDLRQLQDDRVINGGRVQYRNMTIQDTGHAMVLWNAGTVSKQVGVSSPINWGDGSPDPDSSQVDNVWLSGQSSSDIVHYIQCTAFDASDFAYGDFVSLHVEITDEYGITDGCDPLDGKTLLCEVYSVDADNNRLTLRKPVTEQYTTPFNDTSASAHGQIYAYVTKAQHIHPVMVVAAREMVQFVRREHTDGSFIQYHKPTDNDADYPSIVRATANWFGEVNRWQPDVYEVWFSSGRFGNRGAVAY